MSGPWEQYAQPQSNPWEQYAAQNQSAAPPTAAPQTGWLDRLNAGADQLQRDIGVAALRGVGSLGSTLMSGLQLTGAPQALAKRLIAFEGNEDSVAKRIAGSFGRSLEMTGDERRKEMDAAAKTLGADTNSLLYKGAKLATEVGTTWPIGGALAKGAAMIPGAARVAPGLIKAIETGGAVGGNLASRVAGGAITGGASAGLIDPNEAKTGAVVGGIAGPAMQGIAAAGKIIGDKSASKYAELLEKYNRQSPLRETLKEGIDAGYVVPPNIINPSTKNQIIESFSGKQATGQIASVKNQEVTEKLVRQSLGLADDAPLTKTALEQIRKIEGGAYQRIADLTPQAKIDLEALKQARNDAQGWFNAYNRSASPADLAKAKEARALTDALEMKLEEHAKEAGKSELIPALKEARTQIAKTYTVERALNDASGSVNAKILARMYEKGKPLSGGLETAAKFSSAFPSVTQSAQQVGSPGAHNLRSMASLLMGGAGGAAAGPVGIAAAALPFATGPASRALMFRPGVQQSLANQTAPTASYAMELADFLQNPEFQKLIAKTSPVISAQ